MLAGMLLAPSLPAFLMHCHYTCMLLPRRRCLDRRALQTSCPRPNARSRRQAEPAPRSWAHLRDRAQPGHIKVRFLFRAREHIPACLDMRAPSVHHMLHAEDLRARAHARTASHLIALLCAVDPSCFPHTSQVTTPRVLGRRPSSWRLRLLAARAAHAGAFNFFRVVRSAERFCA